MKRLAAALLFCLIGSNALGATPATVSQTKQQYMQKTPWQLLLALDPADPTNVIPILIDALGRFTVTVAGALGSVDQGASGSDADPWNMMLRNAGGTEIGTAAVPVGVTLYDGAAALFGTAANPFGVQGTTATGAAFSDNPLVMGFVDTSGNARPLLGALSGILAMTQGLPPTDATLNISGFLDAAGAPKILNTLGGYLYNGTNWDRKRGTIAFGQEMDVVRSVLPAGAATEATLALLEGKDFATQTTLAALLAKVIAAPATEATLALLEGKDFATQTTLAALLAKIIAAPATEAKQDTGNTSLAAILAKLLAAPATEAKQDTANGSLASIDGKDFATQTTLAALLAKILAAPSTEAKQDTGNASLAAILAKIIASPATEATLALLEGKDFATQVTLAALLAKMIAAPATEAKQDTANGSLAIIAGDTTSLDGKDFATQTTLAALLAKILAAPATEAKQDDNITQTTAIELNTDTATTAGSGTVSVTSAATLISAASATRRSILIRNADSNTVLFLGFTSGVTTANGVPIANAGASGANGNGGTIIYTHTAAVWGIVASGTADVRFQTESD